jgi:C4-type Zn-finger protein
MDIVEWVKIVSEFLKFKVDALDYRQDEYEASTISELKGIQQRLKKLNEKQEEGKTLLEIIGKFVGKSMIEDEKEKKELEKDKEKLEKEKDKEDKDKNNNNSNNIQ